METELIQLETDNRIKLPPAAGNKPSAVVVTITMFWT